MSKEVYENSSKDKPKETREDLLLKERKMLEERINELVIRIGEIQEERFLRRGLDILLTVPKIQAELERVEQKLKDVRDALEGLKKVLNDDD